MERSPIQPGRETGTQVAPGVWLPEAALEFSFSRSSGPGGQNVNKLATRAQLRVPLGAMAVAIGPAAVARLRRLAGPSRLTAADELLLKAEESRSQQANRQACLDRLRSLVVAAMHPPRPRRATRPTLGSRRRRLEDKRRRGQAKQLRRGGDTAA